MTLPAPVAVLAVMAKAPVPGRCKTRLARTLGHARAVELYRAMLQDTLECLSSVPRVRRVVLAAPEDDGPAILRALCPAGWEVVPQAGAGLGERLANGVRALGAAGEAVVLLDSDSPLLPVQALAEGLARLRCPGQAMIGPCEDGGYYAIGLSVSELGLFEDIPWSTPAVLDATRSRCRALGVAWEELAPSFDVDDEDGLASLRARLSRSPSLAPHSARALGLAEGAGA